MKKIDVVSTDDGVVLTVSEGVLKTTIFFEPEEAKMLAEEVKNAIAPVPRVTLTWNPRSQKHERTIIDGNKEA